MAWLLIFFLSYLLGSIPWGYLFARSKGIDIRQQGSGNIGAANVLRVMGKKWGYLVFLCDFFKGFLSVKLGSLIAAYFLVDLALASVIAAIACVLGHDYPIWLGFKGGKGIATLAGAVLSIFPPLVFVSFGVVWIGNYRFRGTQRATNDGNLNQFSQLSGLGERPVNCHLVRH